MKVKKTAWLLMAPLRAVRQRSQWCFLPLLSALFPVFTFFYTTGWRLVHLPSLKQSYENLFVFPANNPFTIGCNFHTRPGFPSSVLELWLLIWPVNRCGRGILDSTFIGFCPIDCQVSLLRKHHHNVLPLNSHTFLFLHWSIPFDRWLVLYLRPDDSVCGGGRGRRQWHRSEGHLGVGDWPPYLLTVSWEAVLQSLPKNVWKCYSASMQNRIPTSWEG